MNSAQRRPIRFSNGFQFAGSVSVARFGSTATASSSMLLPRCISTLPALRNWAPQACADHLFGPSRPADLLLGLIPGNRQIVAAPVVPRCRTGWASRDPVPAALPPHFDVVEDAKFPALFRDRPVPSRLILQPHRLAR